MEKNTCTLAVMSNESIPGPRCMAGSKTSSSPLSTESNKVFHSFCVCTIDYIYHSAILGPLSKLWFSLKTSCRALLVLSSEMWQIPSALDLKQRWSIALRLNNREPLCSSVLTTVIYLLVLQMSPHGSAGSHLVKQNVMEDRLDYQGIWAQLSNWLD